MKDVRSLVEQRSPNFIEMSLALSWRATSGRRRDEGLDHGLERGEHGDERLPGAAVAVDHQCPDCAGAGIVLDVGGIARLRTGMTERNHATAVRIALDGDAEFVVDLRLAKRRREAEAFAERDAPDMQIGQGRGERAGGKRDLRPLRRIGERREVRAEIGVAMAEGRIEPAVGVEPGPMEPERRDQSLVEQVAEALPGDLLEDPADE